MNIVKFFCILMIGSGVVATPKEFIKDVHFQHISTTPVAQETQVEYFFSFRCHACMKSSLVFNELLGNISPDVSIKRHPIATNDTSLLLAHAYLHLVEQDKCQEHLPLLLEMQKKKKFTQNDLLDSLEKSGLSTIKEEWTQEATDRWNAQIKKSYQQALKRKLTSLPCFYCTGPKGTFFIVPSKDLPVADLPECLKRVVSLQNEEKSSSGI